MALARPDFRKNEKSHPLTSWMAFLKVIIYFPNSKGERERPPARRADGLK